MNNWKCNTASFMFFFKFQQKELNLQMYVYFYLQFSVIVICSINQTYLVQRKDRSICSNSFISSKKLHNY